MTESSLVVQRDGYQGPSTGWRWAARLAVLVPIVVAVVRALANDWFPVGDSALLAIRGYDVGTRHHPLLGSWTSASLALGVDVNNPGPLYYDLTAPFMWTFGRVFGIGTATAIAIGSINAAAALGTALVGARMGGWRAERWMLLLVAAVMWSMGSELLIDIWQPHALLLPFCLLFALTVAVVAGDVRLLPVWAGVASLIVQTHVAYIYVVAVLSVLVAVTIVRRLANARGQEPWGAVARRVARSRSFLWTLGVLALAWIQPMWEQLFGEGEGNLQRLATNAGGGDLTVGAGTAVKIVAAVTSLPPWWTRYGYVDSVPSTPLTRTDEGPRLFVPGLPGAAPAALSLAIVFGLLILLVVVLRSEAQRLARTAAVVSLAALTVAVAGLTIQAVTETGLGNHQVRWLFALSAIVHVTILWGAVEWIGARWRVGDPRVARGFDVAMLGMVGLLTVANLPFHAHALGPTADRSAQRTLARTFEDLEHFEPGGPIVYDLDNIRVFEPNSMAVMMRMRELGIEFRYEDEPTLRQMGTSRRADGSEVAHVRQYEGVDALLFDGDGCIVSMRSGVSPPQEEFVDEVIAAAGDDLATGAVSIDASGLPAALAKQLGAAAGGDTRAAFAVVAGGVLPVLVEQGKVGRSPAIDAAVAAHADIVDRVNSTLLITATPAAACDR